MRVVSLVDSSSEPVRQSELRTLDRLSRWLGDDWVALRGWRHEEGHLDVVLVGQAGVMAIDVVGVSGEVFCDGDRWWRHKYDAQGLLVAPELPMTDSKGRSPSVRLNTAATGLQTLLAAHSSIRRVLRVVVLAHPQASIGRLQDLPVDAVLTLEKFDPLPLFLRARALSGTQNVDHLEALIREGHSGWQELRQLA